MCETAVCWSSVYDALFHCVVIVNSLVNQKWFQILFWNCELISSLVVFLISVVVIFLNLWINFYFVYLELINTKICESWKFCGLLV